MNENILWTVFIVITGILLSIDLIQTYRQSSVMTTQKAWRWSILWIGTAIVFNILIYGVLGKQAGQEFMAGYLLEKALSIDNLFVFTVIFSYFGIEPKHQHRILFYGVVGAIILRAVFIAAGLTFINHFQGLFYVFGCFLIYTAYKLLTKKDETLNLAQNSLLNKITNPMRIDTMNGDKFFIKICGQWYVTTSFLALMCVEFADIVFAVDSVPAIMAITRDPFIVFTSNIFAIMGLRSLYFIINDLMVSFKYLNYGLAVVLGFIGSKLLLMNIVHIPTGISLTVIVSIFVISIIASRWTIKTNEIK